MNPNQSSGANAIYTIDILPATTFYNVVVNGTTSWGTSTIATAAGDVVTSNNDMTHTDGIISGLFALKNNLYINAGSDGGLGTITFNGTGAQTYSVAGGSPRTCKIEVNKSSGGVSPAVGTVDFYMQGYTQTLGDFTAPTGNMNVGGTLATSQTIFNHIAGSFVPNGGTVVMNPNQSSGANAIYTINVIAATAFNNVALNGTTSWGTSTITTAAGDTVDVVASLAYIDGYSTALIEAASNVVVQSGHDGGNGLLIFKGSSSQNFNLTGATSNFDGDIKLRKTSGNVNLLSDLQMDGVNQDLFLVKGDMVIPSSNLIIIGDNVTATGGSDSSFVEGRMRKIGNDVFTFPIGKNDTAYAPIGISAPGNVTHHFTAEYFQSNPDPLYSVASKVVSLNHISTCEYWILDRTNGASNVFVTLSWGDRSCGVDVLPELAVARWDGALSQWQDHGNGLTTGGASSGTVRSFAAVTSFSPFALASTKASNPLPIELLSFTATKNQAKVDLNWTTGSETNNDFFTVERSKDGQTFESIATVDGAGNSTSVLSYFIKDERPWSGVSYYRLKQTDFDGTSVYSSIVSVEFSSEFEVAIYPNPANAAYGFVIDLLDNSFEANDVIIFDLAGKKVYDRKMKSSKEKIENLLAPGMYLIKIMNSEKVIWTGKIAVY